MNEKMIAFIICVNNIEYYQECVRYIHDLDMPEGYEIDIICVQEADSMAQGYNGGMQASNAKYKVYLHQDTFILNTHFIYDILEIFKKDTRIGMIGAIGWEELPENVGCHLNWNVGCIEAYSGRSILDGVLRNDTEKAYTQVKAIDGLIMVTQYDVPWREDILDGWLFYDVSQSLEMKKYGYEVVVPNQEKPWCYHECGTSKLWKYDYYRTKMLAAYPGEFPKEVNLEEIKKKLTLLNEAEQILKELIQLVEIGAYNEIEEISQEIRWIDELDTQTNEILNLSEIYELELGSVRGVQSEWFGLESWNQICDYYRWVRFVLLRTGYQRKDARIQELQKMLIEGRISRDAIRKIATSVLKETAPVYEQFLQNNQEEPLVSVIVQVYNGEDVIERTLESILGQTYKNIEVLVVDDASLDGSREIISRFEQRDSRVKAIYFEKNNHVCYGGNVCAKMAQGKYLALVGHDDIWKADKIKKQICFLEEHPSYGASFTWVDIIDENEDINNTKWSELYYRFCSCNMKADAWIRKMFFQGNFFCAPSGCVRKDIVDRVGLYRYGLVQLQDYYLWLRVLIEAPVYILQEKLTLYRRFNKGDKNISTINADTQRRDQHETQWICEDIIKRLSPQKFAQVFKADMRNPNALSENEIICEKAFLLWKRGNCFAEKWFMELLECENYREIFEKQYDFALKNFYELNAQPMYFDYASLLKISQLEKVLEEYRRQG